MLPDMSVLIGQKLVENAKIQKFKCDILIDFQTICDGEEAKGFIIFFALTLCVNAIHALSSSRTYQLGWLPCSGTRTKAGKLVGILLGLKMEFVAYIQSIRRTSRSA